MIALERATTMSAQLVMTDTEHEKAHIKEIRVYYDPSICRYFAMTEKVNGKVKMTRNFSYSIEALIAGRKVK